MLTEHGACRPVMSPLDEHAVRIGIPCAAALQPNAHRYYFVSVQPEAEAEACSAAACPADVAATALLPGLELGPLLAKSTYGRTYRAFYNGTPVAVKVRSPSVSPCLMLQTLGQYI